MQYKNKWYKEGTQEKGEKLIFISKNKKKWVQGEEKLELEAGLHNDTINCGKG